MKKVALAAFILCASTAQAQSDEQAVVSTVNKFFDGMRTKDTALMWSTVVRDAVLRGASGPNGLADAPTPVGQFITRVGGNPGPGGDERIKDPKVQIDAPLASLWAYFTYSRDGKLHHCGTDLFLLRKGPDGWRIFYVSDTHKTDGCTPIS
jgi:hypothetical protein